MWSLLPLTQSRNRHTPEGKCRSLTPCIHAYICIYVYIDMRIYGYINLHVDLHYPCLSFISVSAFDLTLHPMVVIHDFYLQRYRRQGTRQTPGETPIAGKLPVTLRNQRLRFPGNFAGQLFAFDFLWSLRCYHAHKRFEMTVTPE